MRLRALALPAAALLLAGCYRVTVVTAAPPSATVIDKPWQHSFIYGLVPPDSVVVREQCPNGVARVVTEHSFLNGLVSALTWSLYTPIHVAVTCAAR